ncbi:hypothetical protein T492DRAFT_1031582 [Pavlovales sp. CCMP2436]|nr:hypothetical protein T492DRAFT_1031582 [Pavlovales sp. CCMP2436]
MLNSIRRSSNVMSSKAAHVSDASSTVVHSATATEMPRPAPFVTALGSGTLRASPGGQQRTQSSDQTCRPLRRSTGAAPGRVQPGQPPPPSHSWTGPHLNFETHGRGLHHRPAGLHPGFPPHASNAFRCRRQRRAHCAGYGTKRRLLSASFAGKREGKRCSRAGTLVRRGLGKGHQGAALYRARDGVVPSTATLLLTLLCNNPLRCASAACVPRC